MSPLFHEEVFTMVLSSPPPSPPPPAGCMFLCLIRQQRSGSEVFKNEDCSPRTHNCTNRPGLRPDLTAIATTKLQTTLCRRRSSKKFHSLSARFFGKGKRSYRVVRLPDFSFSHYPARTKLDHGEIVAAVAGGSSHAVVQSRNVSL